MRYTLNKPLIGLLIVVISCLYTMSAFAQVNDQGIPPMIVQEPQPAMENVFFNVLWGSFTGGILLSGWAMLDDSLANDERYTVSNFSTQFLTGATYGGFLGLIAGIYLSFKEVTFDEGLTRISFFQPPKVNLKNNLSSADSFNHLYSNELRIIDLNMKF